MNKVYFQLPNLRRLLLGLFLVIATGSNGLLIAADSAAESDTDPRVIRVELGDDEKIELVGFEKALESALFDPEEQAPQHCRRISDQNDEWIPYPGPGPVHKGCAPRQKHRQIPPLRQEPERSYKPCGCRSGLPFLPSG